MVRLGLERGTPAREALDSITGLLERHGQGGSHSTLHDFRYSNGFIITDPTEAFVPETSGRQWAARRVRGCDSISNRVTTGACDLASTEVRDYARRRGWWDGAGLRAYLRTEDWAYERRAKRA